MFSLTYLFGKYVTKSLFVLNDVKIIVQIVLMKIFISNYFHNPSNDSSSAGILYRRNLGAMNYLYSFPLTYSSICTNHLLISQKVIWMMTMFFILALIFGPCSSSFALLSWTDTSVALIYWQASHFYKWKKSIFIMTFY